MYICIYTFVYIYIYTCAYIHRWTHIFCIYTCEVSGVSTLSCGFVSECRRLSHQVLGEAVRSSLDRAPGGGDDDPYQDCGIGALSGVLCIFGASVLEAPYYILIEPLRFMGWLPMLWGTPRFGFRLQGPRFLTSCGNGASRWNGRLMDSGTDSLYFGTWTWGV